MWDMVIVSQMVNKNIILIGEEASPFRGSSRKLEKLTSGSASSCLFYLSRCYPNCPQVTAFQLAFVKISASCGKKVDVFTIKGAGNPNPQSSAYLSKQTVLYGTQNIVNPTAHEATQFHGRRL